MQSRGFTLVEVVVVITILAIISVGFSNVFLRSFDIYVSSTERQRLTLNGKLALSRISRELREALPASIRVSSNGQCVEFMPVAAVTRYVSLSGASPSNLSVYEYNTTLNASENHNVVIYPVSVSEVYDISSAAISTLSSVSDSDPADGQVELNLGLPTLFRTSPGRRVFIVKEPVSFCAVGSATKEIRRYEGYGLSQSQPSSFSSDGGLLLENLNGAASAPTIFQYFPGTLQRNGVVKIFFDIVYTDESLDLTYEVFVRNAP